MLTGPKINPVQFYCNVLLDVDARLERARRADREIRLAFMSSGLFPDPTILFEEFFDYVNDDEAPIADSVDMEGNPIVTKWDFSNAELTRSQEEVEREIAEMLEAAASGTASFEQPDYEDWI